MLVALMQDREFFAKVLGLTKPWAVKDVKLDLEGTKVEVVLEASGEHDWKSAGGQRAHVHGWETRQWRHLDTMQLETVLTAKVPRLLDPQTGKTEMAVVPWAQKGSRWTMLFEAWAVRLLQAVANTSRAAGLLRLDWHSAWAIKSRAVERGLQQRGAIATPVLGMDEKSFGRGHDYVSLLTDLKERRVLDVVPERTEQAATRLLETALQAEQREAVQALCIDMWPAYEAAAQQVLPQARVVFDPFHVISHANQAVDQVRRREHRQRCRRGDATLKGTRQMWLYGFERLDPRRRQALRALLSAPELQTGVAWALKEQLRQLWKYRRPSAARRFLDGWRERVLATGLPPLIKVADMIFRHLDGILAWFWFPISNGITEGFNSGIQALKTTARGYRTFANFRIAILFHHGKLNLSPQ